MPTAPPVHKPYQQRTESQRKRDYDLARPSAARRGYDRRWRHYAAAYLAAHPLCAICQREGRVTEATEVDHIKPHRGDQQLFWDPSNHQPACKPCHSAKTATEDSGFATRG